MVKQILKAVAFLCALVLMVGCQDKEMVDTSVSGGTQISITASKRLSSRTTMDTDGVTTVWSAEDQIYVSSNDGKVTGLLRIDPNDVGKTSATFTGYVLGGSPSKLDYSVYPVPNSNGEIDLTTRTADKMNAPMIGQISGAGTTNASVGFSYQCGLDKIFITQEDMEAVEALGNESLVVKAKNGDKPISLAATAVVDFKENGDAYLKFTPAKEGETAQGITITALKGGLICIPFDSKSNGTCSDVTFEYYAGNESDTPLATRNNVDLTGNDDENEGVTGKMFLSPISFNYTANGEFKPSNLPNEDEVTREGERVTVPVFTEESSDEAEKKTVTIPVSSYVNTGSGSSDSGSSEGQMEVKSVVVEIPVAKVSTDQEGESVTIVDETPLVVTLDAIPNGVTITLQETELSNQFEDEPEKPAEMVVVLPASIAAEDVESVQKSITLDMPNTTVTVKSASGETLYIHNIEAATASNTLIVEKEVVVKNLNVRRGNVMISGIVENLSSTAESAINVHIRPGGELKDWSGNVNVVEGSEEEIIIENTIFSTTLHEILGEEKVTLSEDGYAVMKKSVVEAVTVLETNTARNYESLDGIEHFVNLEILKIPVNCVTFDLSKNIKLKSLAISGNNWVALDLSKNTELESLYVSGWHLRSLDLSNNTKLTKLEISYCQSLSSLDLSGCMLLSDIQINNAEGLTQLEIPNKKAVTTLRLNSTSVKLDLAAFSNLETLGCYAMYAAEKNLDAIPTNLKAQLVQLDCGGNELESFDITEFPQLQILSCCGNQMKTLDVSAATNLQELYCGRQNRGVLVLTIAESQKAMWTKMATNGGNSNVVLPNEAYKILFSSIEQAQQSPHEGERIAVYNWASAARISGEHTNFLADGRYSDSYNSDYHGGNYLTGWIDKASQAVTLSAEVEGLMSEGHAKNFNQNVKSFARIWRAVMMAEYADNFGPYPLSGFDGDNTQYSSVKDVYYYMLDELKEAVAGIVLAEAPTSEEAAYDPMFGFDATKWAKYGNSLRLRLAMRLSQVDTSKAKTEFEAVDKNMLITAMADIAKVKEDASWSPYSAIYGRSWNYITLTSTMSNILTGLGGVAVSEQSSDLADYEKPMNYLGLKFDQHYAECTDNPTKQFWLDGVPENLDPRALVLYSLSTNQDAYNIGDISVVVASTWNSYPAGSRSTWSPKFASNDAVSSWYDCTLPKLSDAFRGKVAGGARIWFGPWETHFLLAEASLYGWSTGTTAQAAYEQGIRTSFENFGVSKYVDAYLQSEDYNRVGVSVKFTHTAEPNDFEARYVDGYTNEAKTMTYEYPDASKSLYKGGLNTQLAKIITQKYIAQAPYCSLEMWNDHRRLGLPWFDMPNNETVMLGSDMETTWSSTIWQSGQTVSVYPQRLRYPANLPNLSGATGELGGANTVITPLWWAIGGHN